AEDGIRDATVTGVQTCALPIFISTSGETYDGDDEPLAETDADGNVTVNLYDPAGNVIRTTVTDRSGNVVSQTSATYDANGNVLRSEERRVGKRREGEWGRRR